MILDQIRQFPNFSPDVDAGGRIWNLYGLEDSPDTLISLQVFRHVSDLKCAGIERLKILGRAEPCSAKSDHSPPIHIHTDDDEEGDEVCDYDVSIEPVSLNIANSQHAEEVALAGINIVEVVGDINGYEDSDC